MAIVENNIATIKVIAKTQQMGSSDGTAYRLDFMSKAAGKLNFLAGCSVKKSDGANANTAAPTGNGAKATTSATVALNDVTQDPKEALVIGNLAANWAEQKGNTEAYTQKKAYFDTCKKKTLDELGVSDYEELTREQRIVYAKKMKALNAPFKYKEVSLHIKLPGLRSVYTRSFRITGTNTYDETWLRNMVTKWMSQVDKYTVKVKSIQDGSSAAPAGQTPTQAPSNPTGA
jgi:hypothetical protein